MESLIRLKWFLDWCVYLLVRIVICWLQMISLESCVDLSKGLSFLMWRVLRFRRTVIEENLLHAFPQASDLDRARIGRGMWEHLILMVCESARAERKIHDTNYREFFTFRDQPQLLNSMLDPRPLVLVTGHYGNFELGGFVLGLLGFPTYTIARPLDNRFLNDYVNRFRQIKGQYILSKNGSAQMVNQLLERGEKLGILGDQHAGSRGCWVEFMGRPASCHKALALFTLSSGAPQMVLYNRRSQQPMQFEVGCSGKVDPADLPDSLNDIQALTQWYNQRLEQVIRETPDQYWWVHRRWKGKPRSSRARRQAA